MATDRCAGPDRDTTARWLAVAFVLYGLLATALLAIEVPPFRNPDEPAHFLRATQVAAGGLLGTRFSAIDVDGQPHVFGGGAVDPAVGWALFPFEPIGRQPGTLATTAMWAPKIHWSRMRVMVVFSNTVINPPLFYLPAAIGVAVGRVSRMMVVQTLVLSRVLTGVAAVALGAAAIAGAGGAAVWLFAVLTLPMSLSLIASTAQDALLLAFAALVGAALVRALRTPGEIGRRLFCGLVACLALVAVARPPCGALALLPLALTKLPWRPRLAAAAVVAGCVLLWSGIVAATSLTNVGRAGGADPAAQLAALGADPLLLAEATWRELAPLLAGVPGGVGRTARRSMWCCRRPITWPHAACWCWRRWRRCWRRAGTDRPRRHPRNRGGVAAVGVRHVRRRVRVMDRAGQPDGGGHPGPLLPAARAGRRGVAAGGGRGAGGAVARGAGAGGGGAFRWCRLRSRCRRWWCGIISAEGSKRGAPPRTRQPSPWTLHLVPRATALGGSRAAPWPCLTPLRPRDGAQWWRRSVRRSPTHTPKYDRPYRGGARRSAARRYAGGGSAGRPPAPPGSPRTGASG